MIFDWIFSVWMLSTIALMLIILGFLISIRRRLSIIEYFQKGMIGMQQERLALPDKTKKKGGWPKGKKRKP